MRTPEEDWAAFYRPQFQSEVELMEFVGACESQSPPKNAAKLIMHQTQRLVSLADDIPQLRPKREALQLLFLMICAEHVAKLQDGYADEGRSRHYARLFFERCLSDPDRRLMRSAFTDHHDIRMRFLTIREAADELYTIRCKVVHEGDYWDFTFYDNMPMLNERVICNISFSEFRELIVRSAIRAAQRCL